MEGRNREVGDEKVAPRIVNSFRGTVMIKAVFGVLRIGLER